MLSRISHRRYLLILAIVFAIVWGLLAIAPHDRVDWALTNVPVLAFVLLLAATWRAFPLSPVSYTLIFVFLVLHQVGAHFGHARVPYDEGFILLFGFSLNEALGFGRNPFGRLLHFCYGLLLAYPVRELFIRLVGVRGFWGYGLPLSLLISGSVLFKLFEWGAAGYLGGDPGMAYAATSGDAWDAHRDMALASLGGLIAMLATAAINIGLQRDFAAEWGESLHAKIFRPLGESGIRRLRRERRGQG